jgi:hypothetical protein
VRKESISTTLEPELLKQVKAIAASEDRTPSAVVRTCVNHYVIVYMGNKLQKNNRKR